MANPWQRYGAKTPVEHCHFLAVRDLQADGLLRADLARAVVTITYGSGLAIRCTLTVPSSDRRYLQIDDAGTAAKTFRGQQATLVSTVPHYGGRRWWFVCCDCGKRFTKLYLPSGDLHQWFACRRCHELVYASQQENHRPSRRWCRCAVVAGVDPYESFRALRARCREERRGRR
jgi:hypothetical protein